MGTMDANPNPMVVETREARPALDEWLNTNRITNERFGDAVGVSREAVRKWRLPFSDPRRLMPGRDVMPKIFAATQKVITPADFYPPELTTASVMAAINQIGEMAAAAGRDPAAAQGSPGGQAVPASPSSGQPASPAASADAVAPALHSHRGQGHG